MEVKWTKNSQDNDEANADRGLNLVDIKIYFKASAIRNVCYQCKGNPNKLM